MSAFERRPLTGEVEAAHDAYASDAIVLDVSRDFETLPPAVAEDLGLLADSLAPASYPLEWLPDDVPETLAHYASSDFTIGLPNDGTVVWTRQTVPPMVLVKFRARGTPEAFLQFLLAEAFVELSLDVPESFLPFFGERYAALDAAVDSAPADVFQVAAALYDAWVGLQTREVFREWDDDYPELYDAWRDAGDRLEGRLTDLPAEVAHGKTSFAAATEYACSAVKHGLDLPAPFAALDTQAYLDHGPAYAVRWAEKTFEQLREDDR
jgi:hypothetical protein